jgi:ComF family protein
VLDLLFPPICLGCQTLLWRPANRPFCGRCARDVILLPEASRITGGIAALFAYEGPLQRALARLKYHGNPAWAGPLGQLLAGAPELVATADGKRWDAIVPVPLHWKRLLSRGFNQSLLLARAARRAASGPAPLEAGLLRRTRATAPQAELDQARRQQNLRGAFVVRDRARVQGRCMLLVDDVTTTGATLGEARRVLEEAGAARVGALALMRTLASS